jgi:hypothetical protein
MSPRRPRRMRSGCSACAMHRVRLGLRSPHVFIKRFNGLSRFNNALSSRAIGEGSAVDRFDRSERGDFPLGPWFRSLPRASHLSLLVQRKSGPKKAHPVGCARRCAPGPRASRGFSTVHPCTVEKRATSCRAPFGPDPRIPPQPGAPVDQDQNPRRLTDGMASAFFRDFLQKTWGYLRPRRTANPWLCLQQEDRNPTVHAERHGSVGAGCRAMMRGDSASQRHVRTDTSAEARSPEGSGRSRGERWPPLAVDNIRRSTASTAPRSP